MSYPTLRLFDGYRHTSPHLADEVRLAQTKLTTYYPYTPDGLFGYRTYEAVREFQAAHDLDNDGVVGPLTWAVLIGSAAPIRTTGASFSFDTSYAPEDLRLAEAWAAYHEDWRATVNVVMHDIQSLPDSIVWGIGYRESRWGLALDSRGLGDHGHGHGVFQVDDRWHPAHCREDWKDPYKHARYAIHSVLLPNMRTFILDAPTPLLALRAAVAAYNCGIGNVRNALRRGLPIDHYTAHRNYSTDVLALAGWAQQEKGLR